MKSLKSSHKSQLELCPRFQINQYADIVHRYDIMLMNRHMDELTSPLMWLVNLNKPVILV